jgi:pilus assembly protein CpaF
MTRELLDLVFARDELANLDPAQRRLALRALVADAGLDPSVVETLADEIDGYGPVTGLMRDDGVTDVLINGFNEVWVERAGKMERTEISFSSPQQLDAWIERMFSRAGARVDTSRPIADARLEDGSRVHAVLPPIAPTGPAVSIRRFSRVRPSLDDLVAMGTLDADAATRLTIAVSGGRTIAIAGATGSGKTTLMNALLGCVPGAERIVTIEETRELQPAHPHVIPLIARGANVEGAGRIDLSDLVRAALRMRPDRIVIGEVRGPEALAALSAMSTGHQGSMITIHARGADEAVARFVSCALEAGSGASQPSLEQRARAGFDIIVHLARSGSARRVEELVEM